VKAAKTNAPTSAAKAIAIRTRKNLAIRANAGLAFSLPQAATDALVRAVPRGLARRAGELHLVRVKTIGLRNSPEFDFMRRGQRAYFACSG
jgi:hypothetical protein